MVEYLTKQHAELFDTTLFGVGSCSDESRKQIPVLISATKENNLQIGPEVFIRRSSTYA